MAPKLQPDQGSTYCQHWLTRNVRLDFPLGHRGCQFVTGSLATTGWQPSRLRHRGDGRHAVIAHQQLEGR
jgi:hypothetical protein